MTLPSSSTAQIEIDDGVILEQLAIGSDNFLHCQAFFAKQKLLHDLRMLYVTTVSNLQLLAFLHEVS